MSSVLESLYQQAQDEGANVSDLVTRAALAASVLRQKPVRTWLKQELDGYGDTAVPDYRRGDGATLVAWRPGWGWIEAPVTDAVAHEAATFELRDGIPKLQADYSKNHRTGGQRLDLPEERQKELQALASLDTQFCLAVPIHAHARVLDTVRTAVGLWAGGLLELGIRGQGSVFSDEERAAAEPLAANLEQILAQAAAKVVQQATAKPARSGLLARLLGKAAPTEPA